MQIDLTWGSCPTCMACSHWANIPEAIHRSLGTIDDRELQRVATGVTVAPTVTDHSTAYPGGGPSAKIVVVASTFFPPARSAKRDENQAIDPKFRGKVQDFDSCIAVAVPPFSRSYAAGYGSCAPPVSCPLCLLWLVLRKRAHYASRLCHFPTAMPCLLYTSPSPRD